MTGLVSAKKILDDNAVELVQKLIDEALSGNVPALRVCIERIIAPTKSNRIDLGVNPHELDGINSVKQFALKSLIEASNGNLPDDQATSIAKLIDSYIKIDISPDSLLDRLEKAKVFLKDKNVENI